MKIKDRLTPEVVKGLMEKFDARLEHGVYGVDPHNFCGCALGFRLLQYCDDADEATEIIDSAVNQGGTISQAVVDATGDDPEYLRGLEHGFEGFKTPFVPFMDEYYDAGLADGKALARFYRKELV